MTLGAAAAAGVRLIVWCKKCQHLVELDLAEMAARYGEDTSTPDWRERARLFRRARSIGCDHQAGDLRKAAPPVANRPRTAGKIAREPQKPWEVSNRGMGYGRAE